MKTLMITAALLAAITANAQAEKTTAELRNLYKTDLNVKTVSIHDPSIVYAPQQKRYYCIGSHMGMGWSSDLVNWNSLYWEAPDSKMWGKVNASGSVVACSYDEAYKVPQVTTVKALVNGEVKEVPFGPFDAASWGNSRRFANDEKTVLANSVRGNQWAPDMVWNETMQKWCVYQSINADNWKSVIVLMTSDKPTGPFVYQGPVVYSGFQTLYDAAGATYKNTDLEIVLGTQSKLPSRYDQGSKWGEYWPNNIDPCTFFDEDGELWMAYGSWSGGIWMLKLDKTTGLRDYTYTYESDFASKGKSCISDPYFGRRIAGGYYVSGEGPYIQYIGGYYYLFMSYGFFSPDGGYEMRVFRSEKPDGPYVDQAGTVATYTGYQMNYGKNAATNRGEKLMGAYKWDFMTVGECAQGHNSACVDEQGRAFVCYHTKFNNGTAGHLVRVHQLFQNQQGWLVAAPFQFRGETTTQQDIASAEHWTVDNICGEYQLLVHKYKMDYENMEEVHPVNITLTADGKVTGGKTGSWSRTAGTDYITVKLGSSTYNGVLVEQQMEPSDIKALCFTCANNTTGENIWGAKMQPLYALSYAFNHRDWEAASGKNVVSNLHLMSDQPYGVTMQWQSSRPDIISETGKYSPLDENVPVDLTVTLTSGEYFWTATYGVTARAAVQYTGDYLTGLKAYYNFDDDGSKYYNAYNTEQSATLYAKSGQTKPVVTTDYDRIGGVVRTTQSAATNLYVRVANPLKDATLDNGFTISMWVKRMDDNVWDNLFALATSTSTTNGKRLYVNGRGYVGFNDGAGQWFDANHPESFTGTLIPVGKWTWVTLTYSKDNGVKLYIDGTNKRFTSTTGTFNSSTGDAYNKYDYSVIEPTVAAASNLYLGCGSFWGSANVMYDEIMVYDRELTSTDVVTLKNLQNRVTDFTVGEGGTAVTAPRSAIYHTAEGIYDLSGRRLNDIPRRGIYIQNGRKVVR